MFTFSACEAGGGIKPGVEPKAEPQEYGISAHQAREAGDSFFVARFAGLYDKCCSYLGFRYAPPQALLSCHYPHFYAKCAHLFVA
jgi:hypothetical protein